MSSDQHGSITPLVIGLAVVVALLVAVVVDASAGYLGRSGLDSVADAAALAATAGVQGEDAYTDGLDDLIGIDLEAARRFVADYLADTDARSQYDDLTWSVSANGSAIVVRLRATLHVPLHLPGTPSDVSITSSAAAVVSVD